MLLVSPNGAVVDAAENAAEGLLAAGFRPAQPKAAEAEAPADGAKPAPRKAKKAKR